MKRQENIKVQKNLISTDAPPLDFSFRHVKHLQQILTMNPNSGTRKPIIMAQIQQTKRPKAQQHKTSQQKIDIPIKQQQVQKQIQTRLQIARTVDISNIVNQTNQLNSISKARHEPIKTQKKTKSVQLITSTVYLGYNKIRSIKGLYSILNTIFPNINNLKWIDLSHNILVTLQYDFIDLPHLRTLYLHSNYIKDFAELLKLQCLKQLKTFTIHGNPIDSYTYFRTLTIGILPQLNKIDSVLITKREYDTAFHFMKSINLKKLPIVLNAQQPPQQKDQSD